MTTFSVVRSLVGLMLLVFSTGYSTAAEQAAPKAFVDGTGPDWKDLTGDDFEQVNCDKDTWTWTDDGVKCTGKPVGVIRSKKQFKNFELVAQWKHLESGGNSGIFVWAPEEAFKDLKPGGLPKGGIEVQILDHGYAEKWSKENDGKTPDWFTTNGDVFFVGTSKMKPFPPDNGVRSFPRKKLSKGVGEWNHYYVRCINGEVRLWVNGEEVAGGTDCKPSSGYLCLESEGAPIEFKDLRIRELP